MTIRKFRKVEKRLMIRRKDFDKMMEKIPLDKRDGYHRPGSMKRK